MKRRIKQPRPKVAQNQNPNFGQDEAQNTSAEVVVVTLVEDKRTQVLNQQYDATWVSKFKFEKNIQNSNDETVQQRKKKYHEKSLKQVEFRL